MLGFYGKKGGGSIIICCRGKGGSKPVEPHPNPFLNIEGLTTNLTYLT